MKTLAAMQSLIETVGAGIVMKLSPNCAPSIDSYLETENTACQLMPGRTRYSGIPDQNDGSSLNAVTLALLPSLEGSSRTKQYPECGDRAVPI